MTIRICGWDKWQTYRSDRGQPPWIKVHRCVMRNPEWVTLTDAQRGQLVGMWLLAADQRGVIPASPAMIRKLCHMDSNPDLQVFIALGFIETDANVTPDRRQRDRPEAETEAETEKSRDREEAEENARVERAEPISLSPLEAGIEPKPEANGVLFTELWAEVGSGSLLPAERAYYRAVPAEISHDDLLTLRRRYLARKDPNFVKGLGKWIDEKAWADPTLAAEVVDPLAWTAEELAELAERGDEP